MNILPWPSCNKSCKLGCLIKRIIYQPAAGFSKFRFFSAFLLSRPFLPRTNLVHSSFMIHQTLASAHLVAQIKILTETCNFCNLGQVVATRKSFTINLVLNSCRNELREVHGVQCSVSGFEKMKRYRDHKRRQALDFCQCTKQYFTHFFGDRTILQLISSCVLISTKKNGRIRRGIVMYNLATVLRGPQNAFLRKNPAHSLNNKLFVVVNVLLTSRLNFWRFLFLLNDGSVELAKGSGSLSLCAQKNVRK